MLIFKQEPTFKFDFMPFQKIDVFFFERSNAMMFCLILDVFLHGIAIRKADGERSVDLLPYNKSWHQRIDFSPSLAYLSTQRQRLT